MGGISVLLLVGMTSIIFYTVIAILVVIAIYLIVSYILESISIMCMSKKLNYNVGIQAFIPYYNKYLLGKIAKSKILGIIIGIINLLTVCLLVYFCTRTEINMNIFYILLVCQLVGTILDIILSHKIHKIATKKYYDALTIVNVVTFGISRTIILFIIRNKISDIEVKITQESEKI